MDRALRWFAGFFAGWVRTGLGVFCVVTGYAPFGQSRISYDRDDPVLWALVRDEEPFHPALPRMRYRLPLSAAVQGPVVAAVQQYVPQIWLGESQRAAGHIGRPDVTGHRQRTQGRKP